MLVRSIVLFIALATLAGCSLLLDRNADQCVSDRDCTRFAGTRCNTEARLCVVAAPIVDAGERTPAMDRGHDAESDALRDASPDTSADPCRGPSGCYNCPPTSDLQFGNGCTEAVCRPFDNRARLKRLPPEGGLSPLPE